MFPRRDRERRTFDEGYGALDFIGGGAEQCSVVRDFLGETRRCFQWKRDGCGGFPKGEVSNWWPDCFMGLTWIILMFEMESYC